MQDEKTSLVSGYIVNRVSDGAWWLVAVAVGGASGAAWGALFGWGFGCAAGTYTKPCVDEPNKYAAQKCSWSSDAAIKGASYGAAAGFFMGAAAVARLTAVKKEDAQTAMVAAVVGPCYVAGSINLN